MRILELILKKRSGFEHNFRELEFIAKGAAEGNIADYQLSAWLMAVYFKGMKPAETAGFTRAMAMSGARLNLKSVNAFKIDKHSTGGVGDGISLALAPVAAACGVAVPMMSGRGLGHTGGTLDKLESVRGFKVGLSPSHIIRQLKETGVCMFGQTRELAPSDRKLYALRDATGTVESLPLIVSSILSKKYAESLDGLVMDVKYGSGAFLKDFRQSRELAVALIKTAGMLGMKCVAVLTNMEEPLGMAIGNSLEMEQSVKILNGWKGPDDFMKILLTLSGWMVYLGRKARTPDEGFEKAWRAVKDGSALKKMKQMVRWQSGDERVVDYPERFLKKSRLVTEIRAGRNGYVKRIDAKTAGIAAVMLGAGRFKAEDEIDHGAGIALEKKTGDAVSPDTVVARLYSSEAAKLMEAKKKFLGSFEISPSSVKKTELVKEIIS
ncbi:MAG: thymidine phosphorylase [Elusimicrobia bacterium]|nr:thymidine phosphorylase [Elusimicrobiota bacterium]